MAMFIAFTLDAFAQDNLPASLPVGSKAQLRAYAFSQVAGGNMSIGGDSIMFRSSSKTYVFYHPVSIPTVDEITNNLQQTAFSFDVTNVMKPLYAYASLHNSNWSPLFYGACSVSGTKLSDGTYHLSSEEGVMLRLADYVPISIGGVVPQAAWIKNRDGSVTSVNVDSAGMIYFPSAFAGGNGMFVVQVQDGANTYTTGYDMSNVGIRIVLTNMQGYIPVQVPDYDRYDDKWWQANQTIYVYSEGFLTEGSEAPVVSIKCSTKRKAAFIGVIYDADKNGAVAVEYPSRGWLLKKGTDVWTEIPLTRQQWSAEVSLDPGEYIFYPETSLYDTPTTSTSTVVVGQKGS